MRYHYINTNVTTTKQPVKVIAGWNPELQSFSMEIEMLTSVGVEVVYSSNSKASPTPDFGYYVDILESLGIKVWADIIEAIELDKHNTADNIASWYATRLIGADTTNGIQFLDEAEDCVAELMSYSEFVSRLPTLHPMSFIGAFITCSEHVELQALLENSEV